MKDRSRQSSLRMLAPKALVGLLRRDFVGSDGLPEPRPCLFATEPWAWAWTRKPRER